MMSSEDLKWQYGQLVPRLEKLNQEAIYILERQVKSSGIPIHLINGRIKTYDSLMAKAERQDMKNPLEDIKDICGIRTICLFLSDLAQLGNIIENAFEVLQKDDKLNSKAEDQFGYLSIHYICRLPHSCHGPRYDDIKGYCFEVQLRTIAMHAWDTISHYLDYKSPQSIPSELRKDFNALSGLFYVADSHFELFFRSSRALSERTEKRIERGSDLGKEEINGATLNAFLLQKYPDRKHGDLAGISDLVEEIVKAGYNSLGEVNLDLDKAAKAFQYYEKLHPPGGVPKYNDVGVVRQSLSIVNDSYLAQRKIAAPPNMIEEFKKSKMAVE